MRLIFHAGRFALGENEACVIFPRAPTERARAGSASATAVNASAPLTDGGREDVTASLLQARAGLCVVTFGLCVYCLAD